MFLWLRGEEGAIVDDVMQELRMASSRASSETLHALLEPPYELVERVRGERKVTTTWDKGRSEFKEPLRAVALMLEERRPPNAVTRTPDVWTLNERGYKVAEQISDLRQKNKTLALSR